MVNRAAGCLSDLGVWQTSLLGARGYNEVVGLNEELVEALPAAGTIVGGWMRVERSLDPACG
jgi:hypothetical protein